MADKEKVATEKAAEKEVKATTSEVKAKTEISEAEAKDLKKAELEKEFESIKNLYNEKVTEVRYIERILRLKDEMVELEGKMDSVIKQYQELK